MTRPTHPEIHRLADKAKEVLADELLAFVQGELPEIQAYAHEIALAALQMAMLPPGPLRDAMETELRSQVKLLLEAKRLVAVEGTWLTVFAIARAVARAMLA